MRILIKKLLLISITAACVAMSGCMQQNGRIGDWFGTWKLESITIDGADDTDYRSNIFFQFQTDIVRIVEVEPEVSNSYSDCFGTWASEGSTLTLEFSYEANNKPDGFTPMEATLLVRGTNTLHIASSSARSMIWTFQQPDDGQTRTYTLKKQ